MADSNLHAYSDGDIDTNPTTNPSLEDLVAARYSRRQTMFGGIAAMTTAVLSTSMLSACGGEDNGRDSVTVVAGQNGTTSSGKVVTLTGTASSNATGTAWTQVSGPAVTLTGTGSSVTFIAPSVAASTPLVFRFAANGTGGALAETSSTITVTPAMLDFAAVPKNLNDIVTVPAGYTATVLYRMGDPIGSGAGAYANNGTDTNFAGRAGDQHDGMSYFGLAATGNAPDPSSNTRGLLVMNHENIVPAYLHPNGPTTVGGARPVAEVQKEIEAHGVSVVEVTRSSAGAWTYVAAGALNRRVTPFTPMTFNGPVRGNPLLFTAYSPTGTAGRGTINNCANGTMAWNTYLTCEENWAGYFRRDAADQALRSAKERTAFARYGLSIRAGNYNWTTASAIPGDASGTLISKFNATIDPTKPANGTGDFRNEPNQLGWVVEIDPFDPASTPRKRTALGRMNHEGAWPGRMIAGVRPAFYMGDDAQGEYIYKFVSSTPWAAADATAANRLAIGDKYLDSGTLYVARFDANGTGQWIALVFGQNGLTATNTTYPFADQADVLTHCRIAADIVGATRMDRPEWTAVNPVTGEMYCTLTNNSSRTPQTTDAANPRAYVDPRPGGQTVGNANGHIVRLRENGDTTEATAFTWDVYAFGAGSDLDPQNVNISGLDATNDFSSPDGLWFGRSSNATGLVNPLMWLQTDDGTYTDVTNNQMLVGMPGRVGDGGSKTVTNFTPGGTSTTTTRIGALPGTKLRRFMVGPKECEITGIDSTPDGRTLFVNIQHPGENGSAGNPTSNWPASQTAPAPGSRPRSATVVVTKDDGGIVGL